MHRTLEFTQRTSVMLVAATTAALGCTVGEQIRFAPRSGAGGSADAAPDMGGKGEDTSGGGTGGVPRGETGGLSRGGAGGVLRGGAGGGAVHPAGQAGDANDDWCDYSVRPPVEEVDDCVIEDADGPSCGRRTRRCSEGYAFSEWGPCEVAADAECREGDEIPEECGNCGIRYRFCLGDCTWWYSGCMGEGECPRGSHAVSRFSCDDASQVRVGTCDDSCHMVYGACQDGPKLSEAELAIGLKHASANAAASERLYAIVPTSTVPDKSLAVSANLTGPHRVDAVAFSPDGRSLAYLTDERSPGAAEAFVVNLDDGTKSAVLDEVLPYQSTLGLAWSPGSKAMGIWGDLEENERVDLFLVPMGEQGPGAPEVRARDLDPTASVDWSPDGRFVTMNSASWELSVLAVENPAAEAALLTEGDGVSGADLAYGVRWSSDSTRVAFGQEREVGIRTVALDGDAIVLGEIHLTPAVDAGVWAWSADGTKLAFAQQGQLFVAPVDIGGVIGDEVEVPVEDSRITTVAWAPSGSAQLAVVGIENSYLVHEASSGGSWAIEALLDPAESVPRQDPVRGPSASGALWSPNGHRLLLLADPAGTPSNVKKAYPAKLVMVDVEGAPGQPVQITAAAWSAAWSPAGERVAFTAPELDAYATVDDPSAGDFQTDQVLYLVDVSGAAPGVPAPQHLEASTELLEPAVWRPSSSSR